MKRYVRLSLFLIGLLAASCTKPALVTSARGVATVQPSQELLRMPVDSTHAAYTRLRQSEVVYRFYRSRLFEIAWLTGRTKPLVDSLLVLLGNARFYGLLPQDYHVDELRKLLSTQADSIYRKDALLTDAFLSFASDLKYGRINSPVDSPDSLVLQILEDALVRRQIKETLEAREPAYAQYKDLKESLGRILRAVDSVDFNLLCAGVTIDSVDLHKKVQVIEINMERWRQERFDMGQRYIWINIPSFQLYVMENGKIVLKSRIITGKPQSPTPVLSSLIECITLFPYWYIPRKIATEEYLPEIQKDTSFLTRNNFDVLDRKGNVLDPDTLDWLAYTVKYFPVSLRQREGPENSLGVIKFVFDNPYAVFLHDTNGKNLFKKESRAFSHGCVRMEKAIDLAKYLVPEPGKIDKHLSLGKRVTINLTRSIPIHIRYFTCDITDGMLNFYDDIYNLDAPMVRRLYSKRSKNCYA